MDSASIVNTGRTGLYREFLQDECDLNCPLPFTPPALDLGATDGAMWDLFSHRADRFENFSNLVLKGNDPTDKDVAYPFHAFYFDGAHWLETPEGDTGYDMEGLQKVLSVPNAPTHAYGIGFHMLLESYPTLGTYRWFFFVGDAENHYGFRVHPDGHCEYVRKSGTSLVSVHTAKFALDEWYSIYLYHDQSGANPCGVYVNGTLVGTCSNLLVKSSIAPYTVRHQFMLGKGLSYNFVAAPTTFDTNKAHPACTYSADQMTVTGGLNFNYQSVPVASAFPHNAGNFYWEVQYIAGTYVWVGVADSEANFGLAPALIGWVLGTNNGRRWARQTGGGVNWIAATPIGTRIGFAYNGTTQKLSIYYNGVFKGTMPTVIVPENLLVPLVGGNAEFSCRLHAEPSTWAYSPPDASYQSLPSKSATSDVTDAPLFRGRGNLFRIRQGLPTQYEIGVLATNKVIPHIYGVNYRNGKMYPLNNRVYKWFPPYSGSVAGIVSGYIGIKTPIVDKGFYTFYAEFEGQAPIIIKRTNISPFEPYIQEGEAYDDFTNVQNTKKIWDTCHKSWGGANGGCVSQLVRIDKGVAHCYAYGDLYNGANSFGVGRRGEPTGRKTRIGSCLVSRKYYKPGIFRFKSKFPQLPGACAAIWTFHYEEAYPGDNLWQEFISQGLHKAGTDELGHWIVRNHEIDIETPSASKADPNQENATFTYGRFNSWLGELRNWDVPNNDVPEVDPNYSPVNDPAYWSEYTDTFIAFPTGAVNDNRWHDLVIDWNTEPSRIIFSIDGREITTLTTHVPTIPMKVWFGVWFPSAATKWAGRYANWDVQDFALKEFHYTPHPNAPFDLETETYPSVGLRPLTLKHFSDFAKE